MDLDPTTRTELEAAAFRALVVHLRTRSDVQNIDLMNLAGFCRNCLSRWYREAAEAKGIALPERAGPGNRVQEYRTRNGRQSTRSRRGRSSRRRSRRPARRIEPSRPRFIPPARW